MAVEVARISGSYGNQDFCQFDLYKYSWIHYLLSSFKHQKLCLHGEYNGDHTNCYSLFCFLCQYFFLHQKYNVRNLSLSAIVDDGSIDYCCNHFNSYLHWFHNNIFQLWISNEVSYSKWCSKLCVCVFSVWVFSLHWCVIMSNQMNKRDFSIICINYVAWYVVK